MAEDGQRATFVRGEGDEWFRRNRSALGAGAPSPANELFVEFLGPGDRVLEIGSADGSRLRELVDRTGCSGWGIDPSAAAVAAGTGRHRGVALTVGTAERLSFPARSFEVVLFGFCLYLVDRALLHAAIAEARRVLTPGGFVLIHDFDPPAPTERPYHHVPGLVTYKADYSTLFTDRSDFVLVAKRSFSHHGSTFHPDPQERVGAWVLHHEA